MLPALRKLRNKYNYETYGGAPLLGLRGNCIVTHGRANRTAIASAVRAAADEAGRRRRRKNRALVAPHLAREARSGGCHRHRQHVGHRTRARARNLASTSSRSSCFSAKRATATISISRVRSFTKSSRTKKRCPTTSQPTSADVRRGFRQARAGRATRSFALSISQALSGTINAARAAAEQFPGRRRSPSSIRRAAAGGLGLQVLHAVELARAGATVARDSGALESRAADATAVRGASRFESRGAYGAHRQSQSGARHAHENRARHRAQRRRRRGRRASADLCPRARSHDRADASQSITDPSQARLMVMHTKAPEIAARVAARLRERLGTEPKVFRTCSKRAR